jgi:hypothetical protein
MRTQLIKFYNYVNLIVNHNKDYNIYKKILLSILFLLSGLGTLLNAEVWPNRVYLATFPRSGNHWMRYMLEELTGQVTFSVYPDFSNKYFQPCNAYYQEGGHAGNCYLPSYGETYIVKTHYPVMGKLERNQKCTIRVVRNPIDAFY